MVVDWQTWLEVIREARILAGEQAALDLWHRSPLPGLSKPAAAGDETGREHGARREKRDGGDLAEVADFLEARTRRSTGCKVGGLELYAAFRAWCEESRVPLVSMRAFNRQVRRHGLRSFKVSRTWWRGLALLPTSAESPPQGQFDLTASTPAGADLRTCSERSEAMA